ncbi:MAG: hypothetical protein ACPGVO_15910 [Spirulinaceae cyanobacterium]
MNYLKASLFAILSLGLFSCSAAIDEKTALVTMRVDEESTLEWGLNVGCDDSQAAQATEIELISVRLNGVELTDRGDKVDDQIANAICQGEIVTATDDGALAVILHSDESVPEDIWNEAVEAAELSVELFEAAETAEDWEETILALEGTINAFEQIQPGHPNYAEAEEQVAEYTDSLVEAQENLEQAS